MKKKKKFQPIGLTHFQEFKLINIKRMRQLRVKVKLKRVPRKRGLVRQLWGLALMARPDDERMALREQQRAQERDPNGLMGQSQPKLVVLTGGSIPACMYPHTKLPFS